MTQFNTNMWAEGERLTQGKIAEQEQRLLALATTISEQGARIGTMDHVLTILGESLKAKDAEITRLQKANALAERKGLGSFRETIAVLKKDAKNILSGTLYGDGYNAAVKDVLEILDRD